MRFENQIDIGESDLQFITRINPADTPPLRYPRNGKRSAIAELDLNLSPAHLPVDVEFKPADQLSIAPLKTRLSDSTDLESAIPIDLYFLEEQPLNFSVSVLSVDDDSFTTNFEVYGPPFQILDWGQKMLPSRRAIPEEAEEAVETDYGPTFDETLKDICTSLNPDHPKFALSELTNELSRWIPAWEVFYLEDLCKQAHKKYNRHSDKDGLIEFFAEDLINQSGSADYRFNTWNDVVQFTDTTHHLPTIPSLNPHEIIKQAFESLLKNSTRRTDPLDLLWGLEQRYEVSEYAIEWLREEETNVLLAKSILEEDHVRTRRIIDILGTSTIESSLDDLLSKARESKGKEKLRRARDLLYPALESSRNRFFEAAEIYFKALGSQREFSLPSEAAINKVQISIYQELDRPHHERTARHYYNYHRGIRFQRVDRYQEAAEYLKQAKIEALNEYTAYGYIHFTNLSRPLISYYQAVWQGLHKENRFADAALRLKDEAIPVVKQLDYYQEHIDERKNTINRLKALYHEAQGNHHLQNEEYRNGVSQFGQAIAYYHKTNQDYKADYLENKKGGINAALDEGEGEFEEAAKKHEEIVDNAAGSGEYAQFHEDRAKICRSKVDILDWQFQRARQKLSEIEIDWGIVGEEARYLDLLLDELVKFEAGSESDIAKVLDELEKLSLNTQKELHVRYGHDYRPLFIHILAAQRLRQFGIDISVPKGLIDLSMSDVLKPTQVPQVIQRGGWSDIQLDQQWKEQVPVFTLEQYYEVEKAESSKISSENYKDQGDTLTASLEQYLQFIAEYYGSLAYGPEWQSRISDAPDGPSLDPLRNFLNNSAFDRLPWIEKVREDLSRVKYEDLVVAWKDGDIVDVRNDIHHNNINHLSENDYDTIKSDIVTIYQETAVEIPILGKVSGENDYGAYTIQVFTRGTKKRVEITTDTDLDLDQIYYFPPDTLSSSDGVPSIDADEIVQCRSHRVRKGISDYGSE